jgi:hypothetical protein
MGRTGSGKTLRAVLSRIAPRRSGLVPVDIGPLASGVEGDRLMRSRSGWRWASALNEPPLIQLADMGWPHDELVLGMRAGDQAIAYPIPLLYRHHLVNDKVNGDFLVVTFCGKCFSGAGYSRVQDGRELTFDLFGGYQGSYTMTDRETNTVWAQMTGQALAGSLAGSRLVELPVHMMTVSRWLELHPGSVTPDVEVSQYRARVRPGTSGLGEGWMRTLSHLDKRLPPRTLVLGVEAGGWTKAYALDPELPSPRLVQDQVGDVPIVLLAPRGGWPVAYDRRTADSILELHIKDNRIFDQNGNRWSGEGNAMSGPSAGTQLAFLPSHVTEWYAWAGHHPHTEVVTSPGG